MLPKKSSEKDRELFLILKQSADVFWPLKIEFPDSLKTWRVVSSQEADTEWQSHWYDNNQRCNHVSVTVDSISWFFWTDTDWGNIDAPLDDSFLPLMIIALMSRVSWQQLVRCDRWDDDDDGDDYDDDHDDDDYDTDSDDDDDADGCCNEESEQLVRSGRWEVFISPWAITACW